jgi:hypothetical protein
VHKLSQELPQMETPLNQIAYTKVVQSGDLIEVYDYEKAPSPKRFTVKKKKRFRNRRLKRNAQRAKDNFRRVVRTTLARGKPAFCTLTMVSVESVKTSYKCLSQFTTNLRRSFGNDIAWVGVVEFQRRGAVHFHLLIWGLPDEAINDERYTRDIQTLWGRGWLDIFTTDGSPKIASYMAKYMYKSMQDDRLSAEKSYTASRNVLRPVLLNTPTTLAYFEAEYPEIRAVDNSLDFYEQERVYSTEWLGRCHYRKFTVKK